jgi:murein DD-endopeptidase MepM/ murein hydrolase activator NlpD
VRFDYKTTAVGFDYNTIHTGSSSYKSKANFWKSPILRRTLHVAFGFTAFFCLALAVSLDRKSFLGEFSRRSSHLVLESAANPAEAVFNEERKISKKFGIGPENQLKIIAPSKIDLAISRAKSLAAETGENWQMVKIRPGDTLAKIFNRAGISTKEIQDIMAADPASRRLASLHPEQTLKLQVNQDQQLTGLTLDIAPGSTLHVSRMQEGFQVEHKLLPLEKQLAFGKGEIRDSLFLAGKRAGLDYNVLAQMIDIFRWNIDFAFDLKPDDTFRVLYEEKCLEGARIQTGNILAAEITSGGRTHQAIRYTDKSGHAGYFSPDGYGMHQAFLRTPVNFTRISSHFGSRNHPILHKLRQHRGVDYSAPHGTPVQATGDGKVIFLGKRGGYGNVIELQHGSGYSTLYAHLSRFPKGLRTGLEVKQGQVIGFVGRTGLATGDHLHYEFRINGIHRNPLTVRLPQKRLAPEIIKHHFLAHAKQMLRLLDVHEQKIDIARGEYPVNE